MILAPPDPEVALGKRHFPAAVRGGPLPEHFQQGVLGWRPNPSRRPLPAASEKEIDSFQEVGVPMEGVLPHGRRKFLLVLAQDGPVSLRQPLVKPIRRQSEVLVMPQARGRIGMIEHLPEHRIAPLCNVLGKSNQRRLRHGMVGGDRECGEQQCKEGESGEGLFHHRCVICPLT